jgi:hypothetical protein
MHNAYIIEIDEEAVGIAARDGQGFRFHAAIHAFSGLDGKVFPSLRHATSAARALTKLGSRGDRARVAGEGARR